MGLKNKVIIAEVKSANNKTILITEACPCEYKIFFNETSTPFLIVLRDKRLSNTFNILNIFSNSLDYIIKDFRVNSISPFTLSIITLTFILLKSRN